MRLYKLENRFSSGSPPCLAKTTRNVHICEKFLVNSNGYFKTFTVEFYYLFKESVDMQQKIDITTLQVDYTQRKFAFITRHIIH